MVGPTPLRFRAPTPEYDPAKVLPPLKMSDAATTNVVEILTKTEVAPVTAKPVEAEVIAPESTASVPAATNVPVENAPVPTAPEAKPESSQMTPQMLLRYFKGDGTREVVVPTGIEFTPPSPATSSGRSSAVYTSPPAK